ncbi:hypothetical protein [Sphingomonas sp. G-3-2-10]|uniref:hypothetical protein n=1 Tax=Sphingomonas sp. G-3-2-10 TaxID=2728838 RepID=UPI00146B4AB8|nr:hypothetical protein [Sphingomonas sp. G-3-2-10]NML05359.1 hypothetical protein [Sphingomonas sp. G-3-2-10]
MKKVLIVAAAAGLMTLAACQPTATNNTTVVENTVVENVVDIDVVSNTTVDNAVAPVEANVTEGNTM